MESNDIQYNPREPNQIGSIEILIGPIRIWS